MNKSKPMTRPYIKRNWDDDIVSRYNMSRPKSRPIIFLDSDGSNFKSRLFERIINYLGNYVYMDRGKKIMHVQQNNKHVFLKRDRPRLRNTRPFYGILP